MEGMMPDLSMALRRSGRANLFQNGCWCYDNYPDLTPLDAHASVEIAAFDGPGVVRQIHVTQHLLIGGDFARFEDEPGAKELSGQQKLRRVMAENRLITSRGVIIEIWYDDAKSPGVRCPLADFFADGCNGRAQYYSTPYMEKLPESYNCYAAIPFRKRVRIVLHNETPYNLMSYAFVEAEALPAWRDDLLYFHATWRKDAFRLTPDTEHPIIAMEGPGHLAGCQYSIITGEPAFRDFGFVMEGNCEHRIDGEAKPTVDYLGMEDSFGFSWGFNACCCGPSSGINYLHADAPPLMLSIYRFRLRNPIAFDEGLDIRVNWKHEYTNGRRDYDSPERVALRERAAAGGCMVQLCTTYYWYQAAPGFGHASLGSAEQRASEALEGS
jgi:hypothetical protein